MMGLSYVDRNGDEVARLEYVIISRSQPGNYPGYLFPEAGLLAPGQTSITSIEKIDVSPSIPGQGLATDLLKEFMKLEGHRTAITTAMGHGEGGFGGADPYRLAKLYTAQGFVIDKEHTDFIQKQQGLQGVVLVHRPVSANPPIESQHYPYTVPEKLYHGTSSIFLEDIKKDGLVPKKAHFFPEKTISTTPSLEWGIFYAKKTVEGMRLDGEGKIIPKPENEYGVVFEIDVKALMNRIDPRVAFKPAKRPEGEFDVFGVHQTIPPKFMKVHGTVSKKGEDCLGFPIWGEYQAEVKQYWGKAGAGLLFWCTTTKRFLIGHRSADVYDPNTWGTFGGKIEPGEEPDKTALREANEETHFRNFITQEDIEGIWPADVFKDPEAGFEYHNFVLYVKKEFTPVLNWENQAARWVSPEELVNLSPLHPGMDLVISSLISHPKNRFGMQPKSPVLKRMEEKLVEWKKFPEKIPKAMTRRKGQPLRRPEL
jgi:8-oxo-dGTP pyrophosphatase MutT (NUDIX family)